MKRFEGDRGNGATTVQWSMQHKTSSELADSIITVIQIFKIRSAAYCPHIIRTKLHQNPRKSEGEKKI